MIYGCLQQPGMHSALATLHFHGQMPRDLRAETGRQGSFRVPGEEAETAPFRGAVYFFDLLKRDLAPGGLRNRGNPG